MLREASGRARLGVASLTLAHVIAPFTRSVTTLSSSAINRKRLRQRFGRISVSDQSHCGHESRVQRRQLTGYLTLFTAVNCIYAGIKGFKNRGPLSVL